MEEHQTECRESRKGTHRTVPPCICEQVRAAYKRGYEHGLEQMRERAAKVCDDIVASYPTDIFIEPPPGEHGKTVDACSARAIRRLSAVGAMVIRALPLEEK